MKRALVLSFIAFTLGCNGAGSGDERTFSREGAAERHAEGSAVTAGYVGIETLAIRPAYVTIVGLGETAQLTADIWFKDGSFSEDAKDSVLPPALAESAAPEPILLTWSTENYGIADVDDTGLVTAVSSGDTYIRVEVDGHEALARVVVQNTTSLDPNIDSTAVPPSP